jgi:iron(II)-dependent oxidoreductase
MQMLATDYFATIDWQLGDLSDQNCQCSRWHLLALAGTKLKAADSKAVLTGGLSKEAPIDPYSGPLTGIAAACNRLAGWTLAALLACTYAMSALATDETQVTYYVPWFPKSEVPMINGPKCLEAKDGASSGCKPEDHQSFLDALRYWRTVRRIYVGYDGSRYDLPGLKWTQSSFIQSQAMVEERYLYDRDLMEYTVNRYLTDVDQRYGGIDSILLWPDYPNIGIDDRNQLDMISAMPGGLNGVRHMIADFHQHGVRVLFPMMMWDEGTHDPGKPWSQAIAERIAEIGADGVNGDTQDGVPLAFTKAADLTGTPIAFQPELFPGDEALAWDVMSWWEQDPAKYAQFTPEIYRFKWLETRHMANISDRTARSKTDDLQVAFFNGVGWESWENVWGAWNGITPRDAEAARRVATIERAVQLFLVSAEWEPFYPTKTFGVFASRWPLNDEAVWTLVNRNEYNVSGRQLSVPIQEGVRYYDLYRGVELQGQLDGNSIDLDFPLEAHGFGAVLMAHGQPATEIVALMRKMSTMTARPLTSWSNDWRVLPQHMVAIASTKPSKAPPPGMVEIPAADFDFQVQGVEIEGGDATGVDVAYVWEDSARRFHNHQIKLSRFYIDQYSVSNAQFKTFLGATKYHPKDDYNFLKDWKNGTYPDGWANKPVTWVSLEDARAYAAWAGKRLPHEWEWQYAAQGTDGRLYPWGNDWRANAVPVPEKGRALRGPDDSAAHPLGASPFNVMDLVGNVWQWTDEYQDEHTRAAILRGGSYYQPQGSIWYFPQAYRNDQHGKLLLMAPSKDRAGTLGFRCVVDAETNR